LPLSIRIDNGPEFIADALAEWAQENGVTLNFIRMRSTNPVLTSAFCAGGGSA